MRKHTIRVASSTKRKHMLRVATSLEKEIKFKCDHCNFGVWVQRWTLEELFLRNGNNLTAITAGQWPCRPE